MDGNISVTNTQISDSVSQPDVSSNNISDDDKDSTGTEFDTDDEIEPDTSPISITPVSKPSKREINILKASSLPLTAVLNSRICYNKPNNLKTFLNELGIEAGFG